MSKIQVLKEQMAEIKKKFRQDGEAALKEAFKDFFAENPSISGVEWTQYTPYFNDGEECKFHVNDMYPIFVLNDDQKKEVDLPDDPESVRHYLEGNYNHKTYSYSYNKCTDEQRESAKAFKTMTKEFHGINELFLDIFGDHVEVVATAEGFKVSEYDHE